MFVTPHHHHVKKRSTSKTFFVIILLIFIFTAFGALAALLATEFTTSHFQAKYLTEFGKKLTFQLEDGPSSSIYYPQYGIYDTRMGYVRLPDYLKSLSENGYAVEQQSRFSADLYQISRKGVFPPYHEKAQGGLTILDTGNKPIFSASYPERVYPDYTSIPKILVDSLLFIENRELLNTNHPTHNPAIEWDRLAKAVLDKTIQIFKPEHNVPGGSTLATQIEKYRHSPGGMTLTATDKLQQIASASIRVYIDGQNTDRDRQRIVYDYINTVPLSAAGGIGEVNGIGDGMWAWYGVDFNAFNKGLRAEEAGPGLHDKAWMFKHALSLMVAQRRPSGFLRKGPVQLEEQTNGQLRLLARNGMISTTLRDEALQIKLQFAVNRPTQETSSFITRKASSMVRVELGEMLGMQRLYDLDRLDLTVSTTLDEQIQKSVTDFLLQLKDPLFLQQNGLTAERLLAKGDPDKVIYSLNLYELGPYGSMPRVQADNLDQPFDINVGTKLDLGSTAKLRTLVTYLEIIARLHEQYAGLDHKALRELEISPNDRLSRWAADYLLTNSDRKLAPMLDAALERQYSASPKEIFYTAGGNHTFSNFSKKDDNSTMTVRIAMRHSVNLVFIRLMRDIVRHYTQQPGSTARILEDMDNPLRRQYLERFADQESKVFMKRFYEKYKGKNSEQILEALVSGIRATPRRIASIHRYLVPEATFEQFNAFMKETLSASNEQPDAKLLNKFYNQFGADKFSLADQGYIAQVHPLELWLAGYLSSHPQAEWTDIVTDSQKERLAVYTWLMRSSRKNAQDRRIRSLLEVEAFLEIHKDWKRLGYPFNSLVPSFATSIGSSADRPAALAELMSILVNDGVRPPSVPIESLHFAKSTPYETIVRRIPSAGERVMPAEVAQAVRGVLRDIVQNGTAGRLNHALQLSDGREIPIGGKTGTGDHRYVTYKSKGSVKSSKVVNRSATFVFYIGDKFYGTLTAFVPGADAAEYDFTSALPVTIFRLMLPSLQPLVVAGQHEVFPQEGAEPPAAVAAIVEPDTLDGKGHPPLLSAMTDSDAPVRVIGPNKNKKSMRHPLKKISFIKEIQQGNGKKRKIGKELQRS